MDMVDVPPDGLTTTVELADRSTSRRWNVAVPPFQLASTAVTQGLWHALHGSACGTGQFDLPMTDVSWRDAVLFCNALSRQDGLVSAYHVAEAPGPDRRSPHRGPAPDDWQVTWDRDADGYRLPTEAEWQLACRAGTSGPHYANLSDIAWYADNSADQAHPVGQKEPNAWGLHDTLGGVWEWCWDLYDLETYGPYRVIRGGGWADPAWSCRATARRKTHPTTRLEDLGFRLARSLQPG